MEDSARSGKTELSRINGHKREVVEPAAENSISTSTVRGIEGLGKLQPRDSEGAASVPDSAREPSWRRHKAFDWLSNLDRGAGAALPAGCQARLSVECSS